MKKYKIGIATFFDANNYGALFQTFALQEFLNTNGIKSCIIDYEWHPIERVNSIRALLYNLKHGKLIKRKKESFKMFLKRCNYSSKYNSTNIKSITNECERFIVGSDQVWNSKWNYNSNFFYLTFTNHKFSYAASFGSVKSISPYRHKLIYDDLSSFNYISVREKSAKEYLSQMGIESTTNIDPVFLLTKEEWKKYCLEKIKYNDFLLVYSLENNPKMFEFAKTLAKENNLTPLIISDTTKNKLNGLKTIKYASPDEFLTLFSKAKIIVTNSFHGTAFSIVFEKQFYSFLQETKNAPNDRIIDLLDDCNLSGRIVTDSFVDHPCDFDSAKMYLSEERAKSLAYLSNISYGNYDNRNVAKQKLFRTQYLYAKNIDKKEVLNSRSGGVAFLLGKHFIERGGVVYGAILDEKYRVNISRITSIDELKKTRNSKYVASNVCNTFIECKKDLEDDKPVLYSALPCQISALISYLKNSGVNTDKLLTVDIVCHGSIKEIYFIKYIEYLRKKYNADISNFNFRDKSFGWNTHFESFVVKGKLIKSRKYSQFFYSNYGLKNGCFSCPYTNFVRTSDITLSDAWGYVKQDDLKSGANIVLINNPKGEEAIDSIMSKLSCFKLDRLEIIQPNLMNPSARPSDYELLNSKIEKKDFEYIYKITTKNVKKLEKANKRKAHIVALLKILKLR